jgi:Glycosyltransferase family 87
VPDDEQRPWKLRATRALLAALWLLAAASTAQLVRYAVRAASETTESFAAYYTASRLAREGRFDARVYDDAFFGKEVERDAPGVRDVFRPNTPVTPLLLLPAGNAGYDAARRAAATANLLALGAAVFLLARPLGRFGRPLAVAAAAAWPGILANFHLMQAYLLLLLLATLFLEGLKRRRVAEAGIALGALLSLKVAVPHLWLIGLARCRIRLLFWAAGAALALAASSLAWSPAAAWTAWARVAARAPFRPEVAVAGYQSQSSLFRHLFTFDARWSPFPLADAPALAAALTVTGALVVAGLVTLLAIKDVRGDVAVAAAVAASLASGPLSLDYHYALALLPLAVLWADISQRKDRPGAALLLVAAILLALPHGRLDAPGLAALAAYPKLYGTWLLLALSFRAVRARGNDNHLRSRRCTSPHT